MSAHANTLIINGNSNPLETEALRAIYGSGATFRSVKDANELVGAILSFTSINRLVIATHGSEGDVIIRGVHTSIAALAQRLQQAPVKTRVTEAIVFDGCNVAGESASLAQFMAALSAPKLNAFAVSRCGGTTSTTFPGARTRRPCSS